MAKLVFVLQQLDRAVAAEMFAQLRIDVDLRKSRGIAVSRLAENFEPRPDSRSRASWDESASATASRSAAVMLRSIKNALERAGGNGAYARSTIDFLFLDGREDVFVVEQRDGGILIEAGDTEYKHQRSLQSGRSMVHSKIALGFAFSYGVEKTVS